MLKVKKLYIPSEEELREMYSLVGDYMYTYLKIKAIEALIVEGVNYPNKGILKSTYKYLKEDEDIAHAVGMMFPEEIKYSDIAQNDIKLCQQLIMGKEDNSLTSLNNLAYFNNGAGVLSNNLIVNQTIDLLAKGLRQNPKYRFTYVNSLLLDDIFARRLVIERDGLYEIEPAYVLTYRKSHSGDLPLNISTKLFDGMRKYANRYGMNLVPGDVFGNETKRLVKCIRQNIKNLY